MLFDLVNRTSSKRKVKKTLDIQVWVLSRSSRERTENVLGKSQINLPGTSLERQIKTSPGCQIVTSPGGQIGTSLGRSNRIFRGRPGEVRGGRPGDVLRTSWGPIFVGWVASCVLWKKYSENFGEIPRKSIRTAHIETHKYAEYELCHQCFSRNFLKIFGTATLKENLLMDGYSIFH